MTQSEIIKQVAQVIIGRKIESAFVESLAVTDELKKHGRADLAVETIKTIQESRK